MPICSTSRQKNTENNKHIILLGDGGMGKSTLLLDACTKMKNALYISLEYLVTIGYGIEQYCAQIVYEGKIQQFKDFVRTEYSTASLILIVDGLNEVDAVAERRFINELKQLNLLKGIQIVVSSRSDFTSRYSMAGYRNAKLLPLTDKQIIPLFTKKEWKEIVNKPTLHHLLGNPMMVTMYKKISPIIERNREVEFLQWREPITNATDLLHNYYMAQIAVLMNREASNGTVVIKAARCVMDILPFLAYQFERSYRLNYLNRDLRNLIEISIKYAPFNKDMIDALMEHFREGNNRLTAEETVDILINELHLLHRVGGYTGFSHQIYRDYLSAYWITHETERTSNIDPIWNIRSIPYPVMEHIRNLSGAYWHGIAEKIHVAGKNRNDVFYLVFPNAWVRQLRAFQVCVGAIPVGGKGFVVLPSA